MFPICKHKEFEQKEMSALGAMTWPVSYTNHKEYKFLKLLEFWFLISFYIMSVNFSPFPL